MKASTKATGVGRGGQKHRNLERNPEVTLVIDSRKVPYHALMVAGRH